ncbi:hypothetical protein [Vibrio brasiliensis]|uniref:hypothetical protein n=1 Tax=Vibrio brasiliensis TaxID=170652 RepID=UPI001EFE339B|nr:hypothetical protein [Vibrio brasiliensis]MCG9725031.1 hypothetical protein [Vibrio brasiliensis]
MRYIILISVLVLSGCNTIPSGWSAKCRLPANTVTYNEETDAYKFTLDGDESDYCFDDGRRNRKDRAEIDRPVKKDQYYVIEFDFKYEGLGGATFFQIHPGRPSHIREDIYFDCPPIQISAYFREVRLDIPGVTEQEALSSGGYKGEWHKITAEFKLSNKSPSYKFYFDDQLSFESKDNVGLMCFYDSTVPKASLGLYRGDHNKVETVEFRNISLRAGKMEQ